MRRAGGDVPVAGSHQAPDADAEAARRVARVVEIRDVGHSVTQLVGEGADGHDLRCVTTRRAPHRRLDHVVTRRLSVARPRLAPGGEHPAVRPDMDRAAGAIPHRVKDRDHVDGSVAVVVVNAEVHRGVGSVQQFDDEVTGAGVAGAQPVTVAFVPGAGAVHLEPADHVALNRHQAVRHLIVEGAHRVGRRRVGVEQHAVEVRGAWLEDVRAVFEEADQDGDSERSRDRRARRLGHRRRWCRTLHVGVERRVVAGLSQGAPPLSHLARDLQPHVLELVGVRVLRLHRVIARWGADAVDPTAHLHVLGCEVVRSGRTHDRGDEGCECGKKACFHGYPDGQGDRTPDTMW